MPNCAPGIEHCTMMSPQTLPDSCAAEPALEILEIAQRDKTEIKSNIVWICCTSIDGFHLWALRAKSATHSAKAILTHTSMSLATPLYRQASQYTGQLINGFFLSHSQQSSSSYQPRPSPPHKHTVHADSPSPGECTPEKGWNHWEKNNKAQKSYNQNEERRYMYVYGQTWWALCEWGWDRMTKFWWPLPSPTTKCPWSGDAREPRTPTQWQSCSQLLALSEKSSVLCMELYTR